MNSTRFKFREKIFPFEYIPVLFLLVVVAVSLYEGKNPIGSSLFLFIIFVLVASILLSRRSIPVEIVIDKELSTIIVYSGLALENSKSYRNGDYLSAFGYSTVARFSKAKLKLRGLNGTEDLLLMQLAVWDGNEPKVMEELRRIVVAELALVDEGFIKNGSPV
jgi:hypothetical protein